ncbi:MAG: hypothetical protein SF162_02910 [bacterium]|nr:hypothetical protein [bacterium]
MPGKSPFDDEYRDCLRAHYAHVIRQHDVRTERTLRGVLKEVGFGDDELAELKVTATAHIDDVGADYMPDPALVEQIAALGAAAAANEAAVNPGGVLGDGEPVPPELAAQDLHLAHRHEHAHDPEAAEVDDADHEPPEPNSGVVQLSMF